MSEWQPIETAPKNRLLLVGFFNSHMPTHWQFLPEPPVRDTVTVVLHDSHTAFEITRLFVVETVGTL